MLPGELGGKVCLPLPAAFERVKPAGAQIHGCALHMLLKSLMSVLWTAILLPAIAPFPVAARPAPVHVQRIAFHDDSGGKYIVRFVTDAPVKAFSPPSQLPSGEVEITLFNTSVAAENIQDEPIWPVESVRTSSRGAHLVVRITLVPGATVDAEAFLDGGSTDLLLGLSTTLPRAPERPSDAAPIGVRWGMDTIVIDAGHGGKDDGATAFGRKEKDITLAVALKVGHLVEERLGVKVVFTRSEDEFIALHERGRIANRAGAKLFVSIHANAAVHEAATGTETYFLGLHKSEAARGVMERENGVVALEDDAGRYRDFGDSQVIVRTLAQSAYLHKSERLASLVESSIGGGMGRKSRGVKQAGFYVLYGASMPAVLVEIGFISNRKESDFLGSRTGQENLASAIFEAIRAFREEYENDIRPDGTL